MLQDFWKRLHMKYLYQLQQRIRSGQRTPVVFMAVEPLTYAVCSLPVDTEDKAIAKTPPCQPSNKVKEGQV
ncbi:hypothetical protein KPH14_000949 [Odynerus spinipes]|uniref:Uncharacterized protein n=1 Tax=Odynerus spinipes TaxID=1348599 RepID=A0AAD9RI96_9HYME|nr:hypothetical protein KPH14_000949 [Odynerus spinipes]